MRSLGQGKARDAVATCRRGLKTQRRSSTGGVGASAGVFRRETVPSKGVKELEDLAGKGIYNHVMEVVYIWDVNSLQVY